MSPFSPCYLSLLLLACLHLLDVTRPYYDLLAFLFLMLSVPTAARLAPSISWVLSVPPAERLLPRSLFLLAVRPYCHLLAPLFLMRLVRVATRLPAFFLFLYSVCAHSRAAACLPPSPLCCLCLLPSDCLFASLFLTRLLTFIYLTPSVPTAAQLPAASFFLMLSPRTAAPLLACFLLRDAVSPSC